MEDLRLSDPNPAPGANEHGTGRTGDKDTDAPCIPALQPWQGGDIPRGCQAPLPHPFGEGRGFSPRSRRTETLQMLISRASVKPFRDVGRRREEKLFDKP